MITMLRTRARCTALLPLSCLHVPTTGDCQVSPLPLIHPTGGVSPLAQALILHRVARVSYLTWDKGRPYNEGTPPAPRMAIGLEALLLVPGRSPLLPWWGGVPPAGSNQVGGSLVPDLHRLRGTQLVQATAHGRSSGRVKSSPPPAEAPAGTALAVCGNSSWEEEW